MFISKASAVLAAALFFLDFPAMAANGVAQKADKATLLKIKQPLRNQIRGLVFSFYVNYAALDGPLELYANTTDFKAAFYDKPIYAEASNSSEVLGNAFYNIQIFDEVIGSPGSAEGNYQSVQNVPLLDKKGELKDVYININGRVQYVLAPGQAYPFATAAKILSISVSSLETEGIACVNVGVNALNVEGSKLTQYVIDLRKAVCVKQIID
ncbi:Hypothetical protein NocV09_04800160 [Nannochloropsis oceanica]